MNVNDGDRMQIAPHENSLNDRGFYACLDQLFQAIIWSRTHRTVLLDSRGFSGYPFLLHLDSFLLHVWHLNVTEEMIRRSINCGDRQP